MALIAAEPLLGLGGADDLGAVVSAAEAGGGREMTEARSGGKETPWMACDSGGLIHQTSVLVGAALRGLCAGQGCKSIVVRTLAVNARDRAVVVLAVPLAMYGRKAAEHSSGKGDALTCVIGVQVVLIGASCGDVCADSGNDVIAEAAISCIVVARRFVRARQPLGVHPADMACFAAPPWAAVLFLTAVGLVGVLNNRRGTATGGDVAPLVAVTPASPGDLACLATSVDTLACSALRLPTQVHNCSVASPVWYPTSLGLVWASASERSATREALQPLWRRLLPTQPRSTRLHQKLARNPGEQRPSLARSPAGERQPRCVRLLRSLGPRGLQLPAVLPTLGQPLLTAGINLAAIVLASAAEAQTVGISLPALHGFVSRALLEQKGDGKGKMMGEIDGKGAVADEP